MEGQLERWWMMKRQTSIYLFFSHLSCAFVVSRAAGLEIELFGWRAKLGKIEVQKKNEIKIKGSKMIRSEAARNEKLSVRRRWVFLSGEKGIKNKNTDDRDWTGNSSRAQITWDDDRIFALIINSSMRFKIYRKNVRSRYILWLEDS